MCVTTVASTHHILATDVFDNSHSAKVYKYMIKSYYVGEVTDVVVWPHVAGDAFFAPMSLVSPSSFCLWTLADRVTALVGRCKDLPPSSRWLEASK